MIQFTSTRTEDGLHGIVVYANGRLQPPIDENNPAFASVLALCQASFRGEDVDEQEVLDAFNVAAAVERSFERLSVQVSVVNGEILFDGDPCQPALSNMILKFLDIGADPQPLVAFMEKIQSNPQEHSKEQAYAWLNNHDFTIADDGDVLAYKGVHSDGNGGWQSGFAGNASVDGQEYTNSNIPNYVGALVEMQRSSVAHDPSAACRAGLHVGTYNYATAYANGAMLLVKINPRDIVSVPTDAAGEKIRVCRYEVLEVIDAPETAVLYGYEGRSDEDVDYGWGDESDYDSEYDYDDECDCDECVAEREEEATGDPSPAPDYSLDFSTYTPSPQRYGW